MTRRIAVVTTSRADFGIYHPLLAALEAEPSVELVVLAGGMHLEARFGHTIDDLEAAPFEVLRVGPTLSSGDRPVDVAASMGATTEAYAMAFDSVAPDIAVFLGDRFEMYAAACAAVPFAFPLAHLHGGEVTVGAIDDAFRHALSKLSHLHFVAAEQFATRLIQMGEEPWRITVSGAPGIDALLAHEPQTRAQLLEEHDLHVPDEFLLMTLNPVTLEMNRTSEYAEELLDAVARIDMPVIATKANADPYGSLINDALARVAAERESFQLVASLGRIYPSVLRLATAVVGNSSSGIIEACVYGVPVVNIGTRQDGRPRGANVIDVGASTDDIVDGVARAISAEFGATARAATNPYGGGGAAEAISTVLTHTDLDDRLLRKRFVDL